MTYIRKPFVVWTATALLLLLAGDRYLRAQSVSIYSTIVGSVTDSSGGSVSDAMVTATNVATNISVSATTDAQGFYRIDRLVLGIYTLSVNKTGFQAVMDQGIHLSSAQTARTDFKLQLGNVSQSTNVTADAAVLNSENAQISNSFDWNDRKYLPTSSPNFYSLTALQPATTTSNPSYSVSFAGSLQNQYDYQVDGLSFRGSFGGQGIQGNYNEWMEQQSTGYVNNGADYQSLAVVNATSKSGTNMYHASGVDYYTSGGLQGRSPFTPTRPSLVQNIFATSAGGAIRKDRTFFFAAFSGTRSPGVSAGVATVPTQAMTAGNFAGFAPVIDPATGAPFPNNQIPPSRISSVSSKFTQMFYPAPNFGGGAFAAGNYRFTVPTFNRETNTFGRIDQRFSDKHSMFVHYVIDQSPCGVRVCFTGSLPTVGYRLGYRRDQNAVLSDVYAFSPTVFNEFGLGWTRDLNYIVGQTDGTTLVQNLGLQGITPLPTPGITVMNIQGLTAVSQQSLSKIPKELYTIRDNVSWTRGKHNMKFGFMAAQGRYYELPNEPDPVFGSFSFTSGLTGGAGNAFANFLLGIPASENRQISFNAVYYRRNTYQFFAQDNIEVSRKLTINLGLRYEYYQPFGEIHGQSYTVNLQNGAIVLPNQQAFQLINPLILQSPAFHVETAAQAGYPSSIYSLSEKNFAPRVGLAYRLNDKTVARAGYGIFYDFIPPQPTATDLFIGNESFANNQIINGKPNYQFPNPYAVNPLPVGTLSVSSFAAHLRMPYTQQWNFTLEHQLGAGTTVRASYIGSHTIGQIYSAPANIPLPSTAVFAQSMRPLTQFGQITQYQSGGNASYNAMSLQLQHRTRSGIYVSTSYTWAKDLGLGGEVSTISGAESPVILDPANRQLDYGPVSFAPTHQSVTVLNYPFPIGGNQKFLSHMSRVPEMMFGGWVFTSIFTVRSGDHLTPTYGGYDSTGTGILSGRPDVIGNPNSGPQTVNQWFNVAAFQFPGASPSSPFTPPSGPVGRYGTAGIGIITGPGEWQEDMGLRKEIPIFERVKVNLFVLATNVFNHPNLGDPSVDISQPALAGTILSLRSDSNASGIGMRTLQLGVRVEF
jgi:hypothetical protein